MPQYRQDASARESLKTLVLLRTALERPLSYRKKADTQLCNTAGLR